MKNNEEEKKERMVAAPISVEIVRLFYYFLSLYAAYVCFKVNKGFSWYIIVALFFSPLYLVYAYATYGKQPFKLK